ncbi:MAG: PKD domain-containing protein [Clostridia bacterium]|nr:MAG: PKD domain-containing protein [Clostridia bacterium]
MSWADFVSKLDRLPDRCFYPAAGGNAGAADVRRQEAVPGSCHRGQVARHARWLLLVVATALFSLALAVPQAVAREGQRVWYVDDDLRDYPYAGFTSIQESVDAARDGDIIVVFPGTYIENVDINKGVILQSKAGPETTVVQAADAGDHVFTILATGVTLQGFTATGATGENKGGIYLDDSASSALITHNITTGNYAGIGLYQSYGNIITGNVSRNNSYGMGLTEVSSGGCAAEQAVAQGGTEYGAMEFPAGDTAGPAPVLQALKDFRDRGLKPEYVDAYYRYSPAVARIFLSRPDLALEAVRLMARYAPAIEAALNGTPGSETEVAAADVQEVTGFLQELRVEVLAREQDKASEEAATLAGLLQEVEEQFVAFAGRPFGIALRESIYFQEKQQPSGTGSDGPAFAALEATNYIYLNDFLDNSSDAVYAYQWANTWHSPREMAYRYRDRTYIGYVGNYYSGAYQGPDADGNGIGDVSFDIPGGSGVADGFPLVEPAAAYTVISDHGLTLSPSPATGIAPLTVTFTASTAAAAAEYRWDFDGDGTIDAVTSGNTASYTYSTPGAYAATVMFRDYGGNLATSEGVTIAVGVPESLPGEVTFVPFYPASDAIPSEVMQGGKAFRYYRVLDQEGNPVAKAAFRYRYEEWDDIYSAITDDAGFVRIETGWLTSGASLHLEVLNADGTVKDGVYQAPSFAVEVTDRAFSREYSLLFGASLSAGWGGPSARLGPFQFHTVETGLKGGLSSELVLFYDVAGATNKVEMASYLEGELEGRASAGFFGQAWSTRKRPELSLGVSAGATANMRNGVCYEFEHFMDPGRPDHDRQVLAAAAFFLETALASRPQNPVGIDSIMAALINQLLLDDYYAGVVNEYAVGLEAGADASLSLVNPLGRMPGSTVGLSLGGFEEEALFRHRTEELADGTSAYSLGVTTSLESHLLQLSLAQKFAGDRRRKDTPEAGLDILPAVREQEIEGEMSVTVVKQGDSILELNMRQATSGGQEYGPYSETSEEEFILAVKDRAGLEEMAAASSEVNSILAGDAIFTGPGAFDRVYQAALATEAVHDWAVEREAAKIISVPFEIGLGFGPQLGLGLNAEGKSSLTYTQRRGKLSPALGYLETEEYQPDAIMAATQRDIGDFLQVFSTAIGQAISGTVNTVANKVAEGVEQAGASLRGMWGEATGYLSKLNPLRSSYRIQAVRPGAGDLAAQTYAAVTVGDVWIVNLQDAGGQVIEDFSTDPLELTIAYSDELLAAAGLDSSQAAILGIYWWDGATGYYVYQLSTVDEANKKVTAYITRPGQYILATDPVGPVVSDFGVSNGTPYPVISATILDGFSGVGMANFTFALDGSQVVTGANLADYYNGQTGLFRYAVTSPLAAGSHTAGIMVQDTSGNTAAPAQIVWTVNDLPPTIISTSTGEAVADSGLRVTATIVDDTGVKGAELLYKPDGSDYAYRAVDMVASGGDVYTAVIPAVEVRPPAMRYYVRAEDVDGNRTALPEPRLVRVTDTATVTGQVYLQGKQDGCGTWPLEVRLVSAGPDDMLHTPDDQVYAIQTITGDSGFSIGGVPPGTYTLVVSYPGHLTLVEGVTVASAGQVVDVGKLVLRAGDVNDDNVVNLQDLTLLASAYRSDANSADPAVRDQYNPAADFNEDDRVNLQDLTLLAENYRQVGD